MSEFSEELVLKAKAIESLLIEKEIVDEDTLDLIVEDMKNIGPHIGAKIVVRAWKDNEFKNNFNEPPRLSRDGFNRLFWRAYGCFRKYF